jgi:hypothetical protein
MPMQELTNLQLMERLHQLTERVDQQQDQIAKLANANADLLVYVNEHIKKHTVRLDTQATALGLLSEQLGAMAIGEATIELEAVEATPEVTISHDMLANGTWRYKTSLTMALGDYGEVASALENADQLARAEAQRRVQQDRQDHPISMGIVKPQPERPDSQLD